VIFPTEEPITFSIPAPEASVKIRSVTFPAKTNPTAPSDSDKLLSSALAPIGSDPEPSSETIIA
jgi:hypothetical protein